MKSLDAIHEVNLLLIQEVDRVCRKHHIQYFLFAGTLIGAMRHKDFIPWDDDVDLIMTRENYEKFLNVRHELGDQFYLSVPEEHPFYFDMVTKLLYRDSQLHTVTEEDRYYENCNNRVSADIFILDTAQKGFAFSMQLNLIKAIYGLLMGWRYQLEYQKEEYGIVTKVFVRILPNIGKHISIQRLFRWYNRVQKMGRKSKSDFYFVSNDQPAGLSDRFPKKYFSSAKAGCIRNWKVPVPVYADEVLYINCKKKDYRQLPPIEKRKPSHANLDQVRIKIDGQLILIDEGEREA